MSDPLETVKNLVDEEIKQLENEIEIVEEAIKKIPLSQDEWI